MSWALLSAQAQAQIVINGGFEDNASSFTHWPGYSVGNVGVNGSGTTPGDNGPITGWTLSAPASIGLNRVEAGTLAAPFAPNGYDVNVRGHFAFIQNGTTDPRSISQDISLVNGQSYALSFDSANRVGDQGDTATLQVTLSGGVIPTTSLLTGGTPIVPTSAGFVTTSLPATVFPGPTGTYTLTFSVVNPSANDQTIDLDNISVTAVPEPTLAGLAAVAGAALMGRRSRKA